MIICFIKAVVEEVVSYTKYSSNSGGGTSKYVLVLFGYRHDRALCRIALTIYNLPMGLSPILSWSLKFTNLN